MCAVDTDFEYVFVLGIVDIYSHIYRIIATMVYFVITIVFGLRGARIMNPRLFHINMFESGGEIIGI